MSKIYILIIVNWAHIPAMFLMIFKDAFEIIASRYGLSRSFRNLINKHLFILPGKCYHKS